MPHDHRGTGLFLSHWCAWQQKESIGKGRSIIGSSWDENGHWVWALQSMDYLVCICLLLKSKLREKAAAELHQAKRCWLVSHVKPLKWHERWEQLRLAVCGSAHMAQPSQAKLQQHYITASCFHISFTFLFKMVVLLLCCHLCLEGIGFHIVYHIFIAATLQIPKMAIVT